MKRRPVHTPIVPLEDVLDHHVVRTKQLGLDIEGHRRRGRECRSSPAAPVGVHLESGISSYSTTGGSNQLLLAKAGGVPDPHGLVETGTDNQILRGMEGRAHDVVVVSRENTQTTPLVKIPQPQGLFVRGTEDPGKLRGVGMELDRANVVQMAQEVEEAAAGLVVPDLDLVVVSARDD